MVIPVPTPSTGTKFDLSWLPFGQQLQFSAPMEVAINLQRVDAGVAIHILRYDYNAQQDKVPPLDEFNLDLRLPGNFGDIEALAQVSRRRLMWKLQMDCTIWYSRTSRRPERDSAGSHDR